MCICCNRAGIHAGLRQVFGILMDGSSGFNGSIFQIFQKGRAEPLSTFGPQVPRAVSEMDDPTSAAGIRAGKWA
jgi:hypothetical protein